MFSSRFSVAAIAKRDFHRPSIGTTNPPTCFRQLALCGIQRSILSSSLRRCCHLDLLLSRLAGGQSSATCKCSHSDRQRRRRTTGLGAAPIHPLQSETTIDSCSCRVSPRNPFWCALLLKWPRRLRSLEGRGGVGGKGGRGM